MAGLFHVDPITGSAGPCGATVRSCPFNNGVGQENHYSTMQDAHERGQEILQRRYGLLGEPKRGGGRREGREKNRNVGGAPRSAKEVSEARGVPIVKGPAEHFALGRAIAERTAEAASCESNLKALDTPGRAKISPRALACLTGDLEDMRTDTMVMGVVHSTSPFSA